MHNSAAASISLSSVQNDFLNTRRDSETICAPLEIEDYGIQTYVDVSPPKWHLAHTSWFFETFILIPFQKNYQPYNPAFQHLFNSYYELVGSFHPRPQRGLLSRPTVNEVYAYRQHVDQYMLDILSDSHSSEQAEIQYRTILGIHHEQQHQELMHTDIKSIFATNPLNPIYRKCAPLPSVTPRDISWHPHSAGNHEIGATGNEDFVYDNECPRHKVYINPFAIASRLVTNGEYLSFIEDDGYRRPELWLSDGWKTVCTESWQAPLYWIYTDGQWHENTLNGIQKLDVNAPVCHTSFYEADAYARWAQKRLPLEPEWEIIAATLAVQGNLREQQNLQPISSSSEGLIQFYGDCWEWTQSSYSAYPGFKPAAGAIGEYNGKFMSGQMVLRGGSCVTPSNHIRTSYRNFFYPKDRWQFTGIRLAEDLT